MYKKEVVIIKSLLEEFLLNLDSDVLPCEKDYNGEIFHYTALKNINSILQPNDDKIILWASRFDCLNDMSEGTLAEKIYREVCNELKEENSINDYIYNLICNVSASRNESFVIFKNDKLRATRCEFTTYITSFSTEYDSLPMWNYYSKENVYEGFNIGIPAENLKTVLEDFFYNCSVTINVVPVIYSKKEQKNLIKKLLLEINRKFKNEQKHESSVRAIISMSLTKWQMIFKNECFAHEKEVRVIIKVPNKCKNLIEVNYRNNSSYIIPYIKLPIDKIAIKSITLGPMYGNEQQKELQRSVLHDMLSHYKMNITERYSQIPIRY